LRFSPGNIDMRILPGYNWLMTPADLFPDPSVAAQTYAAFADNRLISSGPRSDVLRATKKHSEKKTGGAPVLIFEEASGRQVDFDLRGSLDEVLARAENTVKPGPGRPKLGVVSREISLLPRHWDWLESQPSGASAAIRRLVDEARHHETGIERGRHVRNAIGRVLWAIAGNLAGFEEVARAIDAREDSRVADLIASWPKDMRSWVSKRLELARGIEGW
jgi:hypothetical protein